MILLNEVNTKADWITFSGLLNSMLPIQGQNRSSVFPKQTVHHTCNILGKYWSPMLALLWTQKAMSQLALRALSDLESPRKELKQKCPTFSLPAHSQIKILRYFLRYILKSTEHLNRLSHSALCLSYTSPLRNHPELHHLPGVPTGTSLNTAFCELREVTRPQVFGSKYSNNWLPFKTQFAYFQSEPELGRYSERGARSKDQLSKKMGKCLFKLHGLYFSANITDTTQTSQSEVTQKEPRGSTTGSGN